MKKKLLSIGLLLSVISSVNAANPIQAATNQVAMLAMRTEPVILSPTQGAANAVASLAAKATRLANHLDIPREQAQDILNQEVVESTGFMERTLNGAKSLGAGAMSLGVQARDHVRDTISAHPTATKVFVGTAVMAGLGYAGYRYFKKSADQAALPVAPVAAPVEDTVLPVAPVAAPVEDTVRPVAAPVVSELDAEVARLRIALNGFTTDSNGKFSGVSRKGFIRQGFSNAACDAVGLAK